MDSTQIQLFLAIEETIDRAKDMLNNPEVKHNGIKTEKYFEPAPFDWFTSNMDESDLPLFGSIGHMYTCYWNYLEIEYSDGTSLLGRLIKNIQRDQFNDVPPRPSAQYPGISTTLDENIPSKQSLIDLKIRMINNINAITDQGEGHDVVGQILKLWGDQDWATVFKSSLKSVKNQFQPSKQALIDDYPGYDDQGNLTSLPSGSAQARFENGNKRNVPKI